MLDTELTRSERETLKSMYRLSRSATAAPSSGMTAKGSGPPPGVTAKGSGPPPGNTNGVAPADAAAIHTGDLADALGVSPGTVTATVKRLADRDLVVHRPYRGVELTPEGRRSAISAIRRHRIVERFLSDMLGYAWNEADRLAGSFEHDLPQEVEDRMFMALDRPATCPHGFPIPSAELAELPDMPPLYDLEAGDVATVAVPGSTDPDVVEFLATLGLRPGVRIEIREKHPFDGPVVVHVDGKDRTVGEKIARQIFVRPEPSGGKSAPLQQGKTKTPKKERKTA